MMLVESRPSWRGEARSESILFLCAFLDGIVSVCNLITGYVNSRNAREVVELALQADELKGFVCARTPLLAPRTDVPCFDFVDMCTAM